MSHVFRRRLLVLAVVGATVTTQRFGWGEDKQNAPTGDLPTAKEQAELAMRLDAEIKALNRSLEQSPRSKDLYSSRGSALFFRGRFADSVADFDKMVELDPSCEADHWRRGISFYYAKQYDKAFAQFEKYHSFDNVDRENGIWRFLSQVQSTDLATARKSLLKYQKDDRPPFADIYAMFEGKRKPETVIDNCKRSGFSQTEQDRRLFYAQLYVGLYRLACGDAKSGRLHIREAVANSWGQKATGGPGYMWHVARVQLELLDSEKR